MSICLSASLVVCTKWWLRFLLVIGKMISNTQTTFVSDRQILYGILVANKIMDYSKREKKNFMMFKEDFSQAFDCVNQDYLRVMMRKFGFGVKWMHWMEAGVFSSSMSLLVNGSPTKDFKVDKGLRKGDPLSPFLFSIIVEGLAGLIKQAVIFGFFKGFQVNESVAYNLIQFVNDTIFVGEDSWSNLWDIKSIFRGFEMISRLRLNMWKSKIYGIDVREHFLHASSYFLSFKIDSVPFKFAGILIGLNHRRIES